MGLAIVIGVGVGTWIMMAFVLFQLYVLEGKIARYFHLTQTTLGVVSATTTATPKRKYTKSGKYTKEAGVVRAINKKKKSKGWQSFRRRKAMKASWSNLTPTQRAERVSRMRATRTMNKQFKLGETTAT